MVRRQDYNIDIFKLSNSSHQYEFDFDDSFFSLFEGSLVSKGSGKIDLDLLKSDSFIELKFEITGKVELICDRSLAPFWFDIAIKNKLLLKFGDDWEELSDEILMMPGNEQTINVAQYIYEFIGVAIPMKKLHPKFNNEDDEDEFVYSSEESSENEQIATDPRWKKLKGLK
ncbi:MAG: DUF177 domain-containing protein [Cyclobacteriaceae bacterium]|nr:DUF177 domain-containing protein [Cyclobacteriaceae bacterium]